ncbi:hypothetical protein FJZ17_02330 [Candidatus Pacearchaeota archaeon]|nr:hypothetical protein [Candidatus Pacearchaeota archaeon]
MVRLNRVVTLTRGQTDSLARETDRVVDVFVQYARFRNRSGSSPQQYFTPDQLRRAERAQRRSGRQPGFYYA